MWDALKGLLGKGAVTLESGRSWHIFDAGGRNLGTFLVAEIRSGAIIGQFERGPGFGAVEELFAQFDDAVNEQAFSRADAFATEIEALRPEVRSPGATSGRRIFDLQIFRDGASFRLGNSWDEHA